MRVELINTFLADISDDQRLYKACHLALSTDWTLQAIGNELNTSPPDVYQRIRDTLLIMRLDYTGVSGIRVAYARFLEDKIESLK